MPYLERIGKPTLYYELDDFTDPWRNAPFLILQHGYGKSSRFWYSLVPYLSRFYRVIRPDLRALGKSSTDFDLEKGLTIDEYIEDLIAIIEAVGADSIHYCGESLGGILGVIFAARHASRVRTLSLISTPVYINEQTKRNFAFGHISWEDALNQLGAKRWAEAANAIRFPPGTDSKLLQWYAEEIGKTRVDVLVKLSRLLSEINVTSYLPLIKAPVLGIYPSSGSITSEEQEYLLVSNILDIKIIHVGSRYHTIQNIAPASCALHALHFMSLYDGIACHE